ncbi:MAG: hypothetical protein WC565_09140 [Parcubacteria group bacterium]
MSLTEEQKQKFTEWLNSHSNRSSCPFCGHNDWHLGNMIASPEFADGNVRLGGQVIPQFQLICGYCAYVHHFAAVPILKDSGSARQNAAESTSE